MKIVIALGGNALLREGEEPTYANQMSNLGRAARQIAAVARNPSNMLLITHGNGPQVGEELLRNEYARAKVPMLPMHILNAETQASIGSMITSVLSGEFRKMSIRRNVATVLTHSVVDAADPAFRHPTKPVGPFYTRAQLAAELKRRHFSYVEERGMFRRVVPSPVPASVLEIPSITAMLSAGTVVIAGGGGGIPVIAKGASYQGVNAVIDKDRTAQLMANAVKADTMAILTDVDGLYSEYPKRKSIIKHISMAELERMLPSLEEGTMRPKAEACVRFIRRGGSSAFIGNLSQVSRILASRAGTLITR